MNQIGRIAEFIVFEAFLPIAFTLSFIVFLWGLFLYFVAGGPDEEAREMGKALMLYGILVFAAVIVVWSLIQLAFGGVQ